MHQLTALLIGIVGALIGAIAGAIFMRSYFLAKLTQWVKIHQKHNDQITITVLLVYYKQRLIDWYPKIP